MILPTRCRGQWLAAIAAAGVAALCAAEPVDVVGYVDTQQTEDRIGTRGVLDGHLLYAKVPTTIVGYTGAEGCDLLNLVEFNRVDPASAGMQSTGRLVFDATDGFLYVLRQEGEALVHCHIYDARMPGTMKEVNSFLISSNPAPDEGMVYHDDPPPMAIDVSNNRMVCAVSYNPDREDPVWSFHDHDAHWLHQWLFLVYDITDRAQPRLLGQYFHHQNNLEYSWWSPFGELLPDEDMLASKLVYADGWVYWMVNGASVVVVDVRDPKTEIVVHKGGPRSKERSGQKGLLDSPAGISERKDYYPDFSYSNGKLYLTTQEWTGKGPDQMPVGPVKTSYEIWSVADPENPLRLNEFVLPDAPVDDLWTVAPLNGWFYTMNGVRPVSEGVVVFDSALSRVVGDSIAGGRFPMAEYPAHIPFGESGIILRDGITTYALPDRVRPVLTPAKTYVEVPPAGGRTTVEIGSGGRGPMRWYVQDDETARHWCSATGRNTGEAGEALVAEVQPNLGDRARLGVFTVCAPGAIETPKTIYFYQEAVKKGALKVNPTSIDIGANRWNLTINVSTTTGVVVDWKLDCDVPWVTLPVQRTYTGAASIALEVAPNPLLADRRAVVVMTTKELQGGEVRFPINQSGRLVSTSPFDAADIQAVINAILAGSYLMTYDLNSDGVLDSVDLQRMINAVLGV